MHLDMPRKAALIQEVDTLSSRRIGRALHENRQPPESACNSLPCGYPDLQTGRQGAGHGGHRRVQRRGATARRRGDTRRESLWCRGRGNDHCPHR